jgi:hypothetical protein
MFGRSTTQFGMSYWDLAQKESEQLKDSQNFGNVRWVEFPLILKEIKVDLKKN